MAEEEVGPQVGPGLGRRLASVLLAASLLPLNSTMIAVALPDIARDVGQATGTVTQALVASYLVAAIVLQSPGGKLGDWLGHWRMVALGQAIIAAGAVLGFFAPVLAVLALSRVLIAAGGAVLVPAAGALLRIELPVHRRGRAFGTFGAAMSLAAAVGPLLGGELVHVFGWPSVFLVNLPVLAVSTLLAARARHDAPATASLMSDAGTRGGDRTAPGSSGPPRFDWAGSILLAALLSAFVIGLETSGVASIALLAACVVLVAPFAWWERRTADPVVSFALFASVPFTAGSILIAVQNLTMYTLLFELPQVLQRLAGAGPTATGRLLISMMIAVVVASPIAGRLTDRFGARPVAVVGSLMTLSGLAALGATDLSAVGPVALPLSLLGAGLGLATPAAQHAALSAVPRHVSGTAAGMSSTMRYLGGIVGIATLGGLLDLDAGRVAILNDHRTLLAVFAGALVVGLVCAALLPTRTPSLVEDPATQTEL
ncbi:MAG: MFS transporter [Actinomycetes bacterium]